MLSKLCLVRSTLRPLVNQVSKHFAHFIVEIFFSYNVSDFFRQQDQCPVYPLVSMLLVIFSVVVFHVELFC